MSTPLMPDLRAIAKAERSEIPADLGVTWVGEIKGQAALRVQPLKPEFVVDDDWVVVLSGIEFGNGTIEFDALGQSEPPQSNFLGVAFRYVDETTHDAVYLRPFNFRASDPERRSHAVQYISHPDHHWFDLRELHPLGYEQPVTSRSGRGRMVLRARRDRAAADSGFHQRCPGAVPRRGGTE